MSIADAAVARFHLGPVVRSSAVNTGGDVDIESGVAREPNPDRGLEVCARRFSARDLQFVASRDHLDEGFIRDVAVATGTRESHRPSVAAIGVARQCLLAWDEVVGVADRMILAPTLTAIRSGHRGRNPTESSCRL